LCIFDFFFVSFSFTCSTQKTLILDEHVPLLGRTYKQQQQQQQLLLLQQQLEQQRVQEATTSANNIEQSAI